MNTLSSGYPFVAPHLLTDPRLSPSPQTPYPPPPSSMSSKKRKADDDLNPENEDRMSASPQNSPSVAPRLFPQPAQRHIKRMRSNATGHPLALPRLLETLSADDMRGLLRRICEQNTAISNEIVSSAPRPSVASAIGVLQKYEKQLDQSFPVGPRETEYAYNRVKTPLLALMDALKDFTPHFLPPNETQPSISLQYLDDATNLVHRLPNWDNFQQSRHKQEAYEYVGNAWRLVLREATKRGGGIQIPVGGWDQKLARHNDQSGGQLLDVLQELRNQVAWVDNVNSSSLDPASIRQQLLSGTYGSNFPVRVGPW